MNFGTGDLYCIKCGHREPHHHTKEDLECGHFACTCCPTMVRDNGKFITYWSTSPIKISTQITLNQAKTLVRELVAAKGFPDNKEALTQKLLWAYTELGEASDAYKKGKPWEEIGEELIDAIFYILDFMGIAEREYCVTLDADKIFYEKWKKNMDRPTQYGQKRDISV
jgi:NTP pyrophosphatase (non-canonical NTP hydrolase)